MLYRLVMLAELERQSVMKDDHTAHFVNLKEYNVCTGKFLYQSKSYGLHAVISETFLQYTS